MKYYAVKKGKVPGIYYTWDECKQNVFKVPGAIYKSFESKVDAEKFINDDVINDNIMDLSNINYYAFVDGSFNPKTKIYGCGGFLIDNTCDSPKKYQIEGNGKDEELITMRNIAGELLGCRMAIDKALELQLPALTIFYDYSGIELWANGTWKRNKKGTKDYYDYVQSIKNSINIHFVKVKGHVGIPGNEEADKIAKHSVGIK